MASNPRVFASPALSLQSWPTIEINPSPDGVGFSDPDGSSPDVLSPECKKIFFFYIAQFTHIRIPLYPKIFCMRILCVFDRPHPGLHVSTKRYKYTVDLLTSYSALHALSHEARNVVMISRFLLYYED